LDRQGVHSSTYESGQVSPVLDSYRIAALHFDRVGAFRQSLAVAAYRQVLLLYMFLPFIIDIKIIH
jgi:hypothetical protein